MPKIEIEKRKFVVIGGQDVAGLNGLDLIKARGRQQEVRNRNFVEKPDGSIVLASFLTEEQETEEIYLKKTGIAA